jgi:hypothetical protein
MKKTTALVVGLLGSLVLISALAFEPGEDVSDSAAEKVTGEQVGGSGKAGGGNAVFGTSAAKGNRKPAGTGTAAGFINKQVQEGNMKIEGMTTEDEVVLP